MVIVTTGKSNATTFAIRALVAPHERLLFIQTIDAMLIPQVDIASHVIASRRGRHEVVHTLAIIHEAHIVIEFIEASQDIRHSLGNLVTLHHLHVSHPMRIDRPT